MFSLLTKQIKDYDIHNQININNNIEIIEKNIDNKLSKNLIKNNNECSVNSFNPTKNSPPNEWQFRLRQSITLFKTINGEFNKIGIVINLKKILKDILTNYI